MGDESEQKQQQEQRQPFFFSRVYQVGGSLISRTPLHIGKAYDNGEGKSDYPDGKITVHLSALISYDHLVEKTVPDSEKFSDGRFTNGLNLGDFLEWNIPTDHYSLARTGAYLGGNFINDCMDEAARAEVPRLVTYKGITIEHPVPDITEQCRQVISAEKYFRKEIPSEKRPFLVIISEAWVNAVTSLTYKAGLKKEWATLETISESDIPKLKTTLNNLMVNDICPKLKKLIISLTKEGGYVVVVECPNLVKTPYFQVDVIEKHPNNKKLKKLVTEMSSYCNRKIEQAIKEIQQENSRAYYAEIAYPDSPVDHYRYSYLNLDHEPISNLPKGKTIYFNDRLHPSEKAYLGIIGPCVLEGIIRVVPPLKDYFDKKAKQTHKQEWRECFIRPTGIKKSTAVAIPLPPVLGYK